MRKTSPVVVLLLVSLMSGCGYQYMGNSISREGFIKVSCRISPEKAVELAGPHLDRCFKLRQEKVWCDSRRDTKFHEPSDTVLLNGKWYYVTRDNYPAKDIYFYTWCAVKVHRETGEVVPPP